MRLMILCSTAYLIVILLWYKMFTIQLGGGKITLVLQEDSEQQQLAERQERE